MEEIIAIIPARGGSKRLPGKNTKILCGKPLISWTIEAAQQSNVFDEICISTDSVEIVDIAKTYGLSVPFIRPHKLSSDTASSYDVVKHVLDFYKRKGRKFRTFMLLQPTSPLRNKDDIKEAFKILEKKNAKNIVSMSKVSHSPLWMNTLPDDLSLRNFIDPLVKNKRSQDLPEFYRINGAIYLCLIDAFLEKKEFIFENSSYAYVMDERKSIDIDDIIDFHMAEFLLQMERK